MSKLVITARQMTSITSLVEAEASRLGVTVLWQFPETQQFTSAEMVKLAHDATAVIAGDDVLDEHFFQGCAELRRVVRWGVGMDSVDISAADAHGIDVVNTPGILGRSVAEYAIGFLFLLARQQHVVDAGVRRGEWPKPRGTQLAGKTLGVIGYGNVGQEIGLLGQALGCDVVWFDPVTPPDVSLAGRSLDLEDVARQADFLMLSCPLTDATRNLVNKSLLQQMKSSSYVVNVSRGGVVSEADLVDALEEGRIAGAALDVFETEPLEPGSSLRHFTNVILGSHNASNTEEGVQAVSEQALRLAIEVLGS